VNLSAVHVTLYRLEDKDTSVEPGRRNEGTWREAKKDIYHHPCGDGHAADDERRKNKSLENGAAN